MTTANTDRSRASIVQEGGRSARAGLVDVYLLSHVEDAEESLLPGGVHGDRMDIGGCAHIDPLCGIDRVLALQKVGPLATGPIEIEFRTHPFGLEKFYRGGIRCSGHLKVIQGYLG